MIQYFLTVVQKWGQRASCLENAVLASFCVASGQLPNGRHAAREQCQGGITVEGHETTALIYDDEFARQRDASRCVHTPRVLVQISAILKVMERSDLRLSRLRWEGVCQC